MTSKETNTASVMVVLPIYNEEGILREAAKDMTHCLDEVIGKGQWGFALVDNGSKDGTPAICEEILRAIPTSRYIRLERPNYGEALAAGLSTAQGEYAFIFNVDFWDKAFVAWCWEKREHYDLVIGSKRADPTLLDSPKYRRFLSWGLNTVLHLFFGFAGTDTHGPKLLKMKTMRPILAQTVLRRGQFDTEFVLRAMRAGLWLAEIPVPLEQKRKQRNLMFTKIKNNLIDVMKLRGIVQKVPYRHSLRYHRWARGDVLETYSQLKQRHG